jgi:hypothetical protein
MRRGEELNVARLDSWLKRKMPHLLGYPRVTQYSGAQIRATLGLRRLSFLTLIAEASEYRRLRLSYMLQLLGTSINAAMLPYAVEYQLQAAAARHGPITIYAFAILLSAIGIAAMALAAPAVAMIILIAASLFGLGQAGGMSLPCALLPGAFETRNPELAWANAGVLTGIWIAGEKLSLALGVGIAVLLVGTVGYHSGTDTQSPTTITAIPWIFGPLTGLFMLLAIIPMWPLRRSNFNGKLSS